MNNQNPQLDLISKLVAERLTNRQQASYTSQTLSKKQRQWNKLKLEPVYLLRLTVKVGVQTLRLSGLHLGINPEVMQLLEDQALGGYRANTSQRLKDAAHKLQARQKIIYNRYTVLSEPFRLVHEASLPDALEAIDVMQQEAQELRQSIVTAHEEEFTAFLSWAHQILTQAHLEPKAMRAALTYYADAYPTQEDVEQCLQVVVEGPIKIPSLRAAVAETEEKLLQVSQWLEMMGLSWGISEGTEQTVSSAEKIELANKIATNEKLKLIAKLSGSLKDIADKKRRIKTEDAFGELSTIELGNNLTRLLPLELQKLAQPELFPLFAKGYYEHSLLQYKILGKEKKSKGPLIVCLDSSGSMAGLPDTWAKAVTAVLLQIAHKDNRHFRVIHFDTRVRRTDDFPPKHHDYWKFLDSMLSFYSGGGTNWEPALFEAIKCLDNNKSLHKADIVLITDALCDMRQDVLEKLKQHKQHLETNIFSILIGNHNEKNLTKFCDRIWVIRDLSPEASNQIEELFLI